MATAVNDEELQLKKRARRRLVGAIVLVTTVAVVLPMILDPEPRPPGQNIDIQIPSPDAALPATKPEPLKPVDPVPAAAIAQAEPQPQSEAPAKAVAEAVVEKQAEKPAAREGAAAEARGEPAAVTAAPKPAAAAKDAPKREVSGTRGFVIQVAALSDVAKAKELQARIATGGLKAYTEVVQTAKGPVTRVRVGPYPSREAAEKARPQLQKLQLDGKVVPR